MGMMAWSKAFALRAANMLLKRRGYRGTDLVVARHSVRDWARARLHRRGLLGSLGGLAVVIPRVGQAEIVPVEVPLPGPGEITIQVFVSAISPGTERAQWLRRPHAQLALPSRPGYSGAGQILAVGKGVTGLTVGEMVAVSRLPHTSVATVPANWAIRIPPGVELDQAALVYMAIISGYGVRRAQLIGGESVCVFGAGLIGALAARFAQAAGADRLTVVTRSPRHQGSATLSGADFRVASDGVADICADVVIEATGDPQAIGDAVLATRDGGKIILLGSSRGISSAVPVADLQSRRITVIGAHISALASEQKRDGGDPFNDIAKFFLDEVAAGTFPVSDLIGEPINPREIGLMYRKLADGTLDAAHLDWTKLAKKERLFRRSPWHAPLLPPRSGVIPAPAVEPVSAQARRLRFAVIGCGDIGFSNARAIAQSRNAELVLAYDADPALAEATARAHGGAAAGTIEEAFDRERIDAVFLSVPHDVHTPLIQRAAAAGLDIIVEKPLAHNLQAAMDAAEAARAAGVTLSVCFPYRYEPAAATALALVKAGALGTLRGASLTFHADKPQAYWQGGFSNRANSDWRTIAERSGGGVLIMNLTHFIDLLRHLAACEVTEVSAAARFDPGKDVEDQIAVQALFEGGAVGTFFGSATTAGVPSTRLEIFGDHGTIDLGPEPRVFTRKALTGVQSGRWNALANEEIDVRPIFIERFVDAVQQRREPDVTVADALAVQAIVEAVYRSVRSGRPEPVMQTKG